MSEVDASVGDFSPRDIDLKNDSDEDDLPSNLKNIDFNEVDMDVISCYS